MEDMRTLMPHHKTEPKFEKKNSFRELAEVRRFPAQMLALTLVVRDAHICNSRFEGARAAARTGPPEVCELKSCNNCVYFEARKKKDLYMWIARVRPDCGASRAR